MSGKLEAVRKNKGALQRDNDHQAFLDKNCHHFKQYHLQKISSAIKTPQGTLLIPWWSYKVFDHDANFHQRHDKENNFFKFDSDQNFQIEMFYLNCLQGLQGFKFGDEIKMVGDQNQIKNGYIYKVWGANKNPNSWYEQNTTLSGAPQRQLKRVFIETEDEGDSAFGLRAEVVAKVSQCEYEQLVEQGEEEEDVDFCDFPINMHRSDIQVKGEVNEIKRLREQVNGYSSTAENFVEEIDVDIATDPQLIEELKKQCKDLYDISDMKPVSKTATLLKLQVIGFNCKNAKRHILKTLIAHSSQLDKYPSYWENVDNLKKQKIIVKEVFIGTEEFNKIATQFKSTLPKAVVLKVERIQNINLWRQFQLESDRIKEKLGGNPDSVNIRYAYHGTGNTPPQTIYMSEDGFNVNYCSDGSLWGKANYFAVKSEYSHSYRHKTSKGTFQMFYARVILGRAKLLGQDKSLREPPMVEGSSNVRYDSVQGFASGSDIFMVYSNKKAYPEYLITYKSD